MAIRVLWADDEMEFLKPHVLFLETKGYSVDLINNGSDAVEMVSESTYDIVFLDENMPGISGLEALSRIKEIKPHLPVVMITKSEEESIMEEAIGSKIADYLIKPVNPNQLLLCLKKNLDQGKLVSQKSNSNYQQEFRQLGMQLNGRLNTEEWKEVFKKLTYWDLELHGIEDKGMLEILNAQKKEANDLFCRYIERNYEDWFNGQEDAPEMVHHLFRDHIFPMLKEKVYVIVIDNLRYDQWNVLKPTLSKHFTVESEEIVYSILPTATHYARNALFAGLMPNEIAKRFPNHWLNEEDEGGKNMHEAVFLEGNMKRNGVNVKWSYNKITNLDAGKKLVDNFHSLKDNQLNVIVYNFVDMLSHARTEMDMIKELAGDEAAYRSLTLSWFEHSPLQEIFKKAAEQKAKVVITTDHGTVRVNEPVKIVGDKSTNTNLRYKTGRNLNYKEKEVFTIKHPEKVGLPKSNLSSEFVFTRENDYFVYPNNYNHFVNYYNDTFQHGGISMEELMIPFYYFEFKMKEWVAYSLSDLPHIAKELLNHLGTEIKVVCFEAPMGSGKTTFISALLRSMGIEEIEGSPTYSIVNSYESTFYGEVFHFDLYRLKSLEETLDIGFEEMVYSDAYCFIEWAEKVEHILPLPYAKVSISVEMIREYSLISQSQPSFKL